MDRDTQAQIASVIWNDIEEGRPVTDVQRSQLCDFINGKDIVTWDVAGETIEMIKQMDADLAAGRASPAVRRALRHFNACDGNRALPYSRDELGRMVRDAWVRWALMQPDPKSAWLASYDELPEADKEADRQIGEHVARMVIIGDAANASLARWPLNDD